MQTILFHGSGLSLAVKKHPVLVFILLFTVQMIIFYLAYMDPRVQNGLLLPWMNHYAEISGKLLNILNQDVDIFSTAITSNRFAVDIKRGCDAVEAMAILAAGIIAFPARARYKLTGMAAGLFLIWVLNILRIAGLFLTGVYMQSLFDIMHLEISQMIFILIAIGMWFSWLQWINVKSRDK